MATSGQRLPPMEHISSVNQSQVKMSVLTFKKAMHSIARQCNPPGIGRVIEGQQHWQTHWNVAESDSLTQIWGQCAGYCSTNTGATHKTRCSLICFLSLISVNTKCYFKEHLHVGHTPSAQATPAGPSVVSGWLAGWGDVYTWIWSANVEKKTWVPIQVTQPPNVHHQWDLLLVRSRSFLLIMVVGKCE